jgi:murein DD-endopeptidase MepM/ murein hydrolase activator NlpD
VSDTVPRHRKQSDVARHARPSRRRKQYATEANGRKARRTSIVVGVVTAAAAVAAAVVFGLPALSTGTPTDASQTAAGQVTDTLGSSLAGDTGHAMNQLPQADAAKSSRLGKSARPKAGKPAVKAPAKAPAAKTPAKAPAATTRHAATAKKAAAPVYLNPLRQVSGLMAERIDMGADFGGTGPVYAIGNAVITNSISNSPGWPGGGWITYQLTDGPAKGLMVYLAEDVTPTVQVGQHVTPNTVIANMSNGGAGIETGWAMPDGSSAESQLPEAGGISGQGPFPTAVGINFDQLLHALGVPVSPFNGNATPYGVLPSGYPTSYSGL